jgi:phosphatidylinositol glycan class W
VLWIHAFNAAFLFLYKAAADYILSVGSIGDSAVPELLNAINKNGMMVFLAVSTACDAVRLDADCPGQANLMTGAINLRVRTLEVPDPTAVCLLAVYLIAVCGTAWKVRGVKLL